MSAPQKSHQDAILTCLRGAQALERRYLSTYESRCEALTYETLRTFDDLFCRDLMEPDKRTEKTQQSFRNLSTWGVNHALSRIMPKVLVDGPFRDFPSKAETQVKADDFVLHCGLLAVSERLEGWLEDGIVIGEFGPAPKSLEKVIVIRSASQSYSDEEIGRAGGRWASDLIWQEDRSIELELETRHREIEPKLEQSVELIDGWRMVYSSTRAIDEYFQEWARLYLRRMHFQDMLGLDDQIGGRPFSRFIEVLTALSGRSQLHIAYAAILRARHPAVHLRNLLTTYCPRQFLIEWLAGFMDADTQEIDAILNSFVLTNENLATHTQSGEMTYAPIVQASTRMLILPTYGMDLNPFLFLLTDLRHRYESDWFKAANNREGRWLDELSRMFSNPRWMINRRNLKLRQDGKDLTDIDFAAYDTNANELAIFQLKWQQPIGMDNRARRSTGKNLLEQGNRWIDAVLHWLDLNGVAELMKRLSFTGNQSPKVFLFVLGRYNVHFSGFNERDDRSAWSDWAHFRRIWLESSGSQSPAQLFANLREVIQRSRENKVGESTMFPIGNIAVALNPISVPQSQ